MDDSFSCSVRLTQDDWRAYQKECARRVRRLVMRRWIAVLLQVAAVVVATTAFFDLVNVPLQLLSVLAGAVLGLVAVLLYLRVWVAASAPARDGLFYREFRYTLDAEGIRVVRPGIEAITQWPAVRKATSSGEHLYLWIDRLQAHVIPWRELPGATSPAELEAAVERWRGQSMTVAASASAVADPPPAVATEPGGRSWFSGLPRLLALRSAAGLTEAPVRLVWLLGGLALVAWAGVDRLRAGPDALFSAYGAPDIAWYVLMLITVAAALSWYSRPRVTLRSALAALLVVSILLLGLAALFIRIPIPRAVVIIGLAAAGLYSIAFAARMLQSVSGRGQVRAVLSAGLVSLVAWLATTGLYVEPALWYAPDNEVDPDYSVYWEEGESLIFEQPARIEAAVADVVPPEDGAPAVFFLGFAGFGEQRVFAEEIKFASQVLAERYGTAERSVLLLNDRRDLDSEPLATVSSLRYALRALARKMDLDEDILFLALSSHGSEDHLAISHGPLMLDDLTDTVLADALDDAGIKWRVILISACHSGSFIDALRNPNTIVITAAAADRTSFGCSDDRDLTYFGEAFYRDALPGAASLREAFETAVREIVERERREDVEPSHPQAYFGNAIERRLELLSPAP